MRAMALSMLILVAACSSAKKELPRPTGEVFRMNPDRVGTTANDLKRPTGVDR